LTLSLRHRTQATMAAFGAPRGPPRPMRALLPVLLVALVAVAAHARVSLRHLLATLPPVQLAPVQLPVPTVAQAPFNLSQPVYGPCAAVSKAIGKTVSAGTWSGPMQCAGFDTEYYVGDQAGTDGRSMACFNLNGYKCSSPGSCPDCIYPPQSDTDWACWSTGNWYWPLDCGYRPVYTPWHDNGPGMGYCLVRHHSCIDAGRECRVPCAGPRCSRWWLQ
jgi:hypothetical protein